MYSDKENINILTALLVAHGIGHAVVCPGSRNAPIVHNLEACPEIACHSVTDERSAGFYALGLAQATGQPVVVCVTSGTALLNVLPAVAEAQYQHLPLVVVSADRPRQWIDQLDGQTLPQDGTLTPFVQRSVSLPEPRNDEERWLCNRLVNEALCRARYRQSGPVHINVPVSEPLFHFTCPTLPKERMFSVTTPCHERICCNSIFESLQQRKRGMLVMGCGNHKIFDEKLLQRVSRSFVVLYEPLTADAAAAVPFDEVLAALGEDENDYRPDFILYLGGTIVSKRLRHFLRRSEAPTWLLTTDASAMPDPTMHLDRIIVCADEKEMRLFVEAMGESGERREERGERRKSGERREERGERIVEGGESGKRREERGERIVEGDWSAGTFCSDRGQGCTPITNLSPLSPLLSSLSPLPSPLSFTSRWNAALRQAERHKETFEPRYSQMAAVKYFEQQLDDLYQPFCVHYANSTAIRLACIYAGHRVWCNRGVNGIEGSLSTAAGFSLGTDRLVFCVIGDLSFFYDQNALWNSALGGNLRIILLNNHRGGIFSMLPGLENSPAARTAISGSHATDAHGICEQCDVGYLRATDMEEMRLGMVTLLTRDARRPMVLEVMTDADTDAKEMKRYYETFKLL